MVVIAMKMAKDGGNVETISDDNNNNNIGSDSNNMSNGIYDNIDADVKRYSIKNSFKTKVWRTF